MPRFISVRIHLEGPEDRKNEEERQKRQKDELLDRQKREYEQRQLGVRRMGP